MSVEPSLPEPGTPDPNGPPVLSYGTQKFGWSMLQVGVTTTLVVAAGGVVAFLALTTVATPTMGALRIHRIQWQARQLEIAQAQAESVHQQETATAEQLHD